MIVIRAARAIGSSSMVSGVRSGCTSRRGLVSTRPFTVTRPASISRTASARDATPSFDKARASGTPACIRIASDAICFSPIFRRISRVSNRMLTCDHLVTYYRLVVDDDDRVFKALADRTRRFLLDRLFAQDGRTLTELESELEMTRFGVMKHLRVLEEAGLVVVRRQGREKLHFLNPVPIRLIHDRWIDKYTEPQVTALTTLKAELEGDDELPTG